MIMGTAALRKGRSRISQISELEVVQTNFLCYNANKRPECCGSGLQLRHSQSAKGERYENCTRGG